MSTVAVSSSVCKERWQEWDTRLVRVPHGPCPRSVIALDALGVLPKRWRVKLTG
jgi:hypothetical protein